MKDDLIELPELSDVKEMLTLAKKDIEEEIKQNPEMVDSCSLLKQVIAVVEEKIGKIKDFNKLNTKERIDIAAHLSFLHSLLENFFYGDEDDFFDSEEFDDEEFDDEDFDHEEEFEEETSDEE
jgi:hypothetical protein